MSIAAVAISALATISLIFIFVPGYNALEGKLLAKYNCSLLVCNLSICVTRNFFISSGVEYSSRKSDLKLPAVDPVSPSTVSVSLKVLSSNNNLVKKKVDDKNLENDLTSTIKNQLKNTDQIKTSPIKNLSTKSINSKIEISNFQDLINLSNNEKEVELKFDLERNVKLVSFNKGKIDISFNENLNKNFIKNLTEKLLLWTGERWIISLSKNTKAKSIYEQNIEQKSSKLVEFKNSELAKQIEEAFPDAKLKDIQEEKYD